MSDFHRYYIPNAIVFITMVTQDRHPYFRDDQDVELLFDTMRTVQSIHRFNLLAYVVLPDHIHVLLRVGDLSGNFSVPIHSIKRNFTLNYKSRHAITNPLSVWQSKFWDHIIRDERDLSIHFDYIHWNPVKHGYAVRPEDWTHSTYRHWLDKGQYEVGWGCSGEPSEIKGVKGE